MLNTIGHAGSYVQAFISPRVDYTMSTTSRRAEMRMLWNVNQIGLCSRRPLWKQQLSTVVRKSEVPLGVATSGPRRRKMLKSRRRFSRLGWLGGLWKQLTGTVLS